VPFDNPIGASGAKALAEKDSIKRANLVAPGIRLVPTLKRITFFAIQKNEKHFATMKNTLPDGLQEALLSQRP